MMITQTVSTITAEKARFIAEDFLIDHLGDQTMAGEPLLIRSALSSAWVVPIVLTRSAYGPVGVIGSLKKRFEPAWQMSRRKALLIQK